MQKLFIYLVISSLWINAGCEKSTPNPEIITDPVDSTFYNPDKFVMGADLSYVNAVEENGGKYFDASGVSVDPFKYFKNSGANVVRVRLWHNPSWQNAIYGSIKYSSLADATKTIKRAKEAGMAVNLDLHFSDIWADPANQATPKAWENLTITTLKDSIYNYTLAVLNHLKSQNLTPEYIQIGNENNGGICFPSGKIANNDFSNFGKLISSGIKAVRDFSASSSIKPQIILHVAQLQNADWWANGVINSGGVTDFDILGLSHYYIWSQVSNMPQIKMTIADLAYKYKKKVMIVETAFPWTNASNDSYNNIISGSDLLAGYPATKDGQLKYMKDLTQAVIDGGGKGIMYWEPAWITSGLKDLWGTGSSWENNAFFDFSGKALPVFDYMTYPYKF